MKQEQTEGSSPQSSHTYRELCEAFFEIKYEIAAYTHKPLTQGTIDALPSMVRLANEQKIKNLGLDPNIKERLRVMAENNKLFERIIPEDAYDGAVKDKGSLGNFFRPYRRPRKEK
jgi:hypothetical protein